jgi:hypothetical protein
MELRFIGIRYQKIICVSGEIMVREEWLDENY